MFLDMVKLQQEDLNTNWMTGLEMQTHCTQSKALLKTAVHSLGSKSQALEAILSQYASQSNRLLMLQKKESPLGSAITDAMDTAPWRSFECSNRLPLRKTLPSRSSQNIQLEEIPA